MHSSEAFTNRAELDTNGNAPAEQKIEINQSEDLFIASPISATVSEDSPAFPPLSENSIDFDFIEKPNQLRSQVNTVPLITFVMVANVQKSL